MIYNINDFCCENKCSYRTIMFELLYKQLIMLVTISCKDHHGFFKKIMKIVLRIQLNELVVQLYSTNDP